MPQARASQALISSAHPVEPQSLMGWILIVSSLLTQYLSFKSAELLKHLPISST